MRIYCVRIGQRIYRVKGSLRKALVRAFQSHIRNKDLRRRRLSLRIEWWKDEL